MNVCKRAGYESLESEIKQYMRVNSSVNPIPRDNPGECFLYRKNKNGIQAGPSRGTFPGSHGWSRGFKFGRLKFTSAVLWIRLWNPVVETVSGWINRNYDVCFKSKISTNCLIKGGDCCDGLATCSCGAHSGFYSCICPRGYFGRGLKGDCHSEYWVSHIQWFFGLGLKVDWCRVSHILH